jgi:hypothetical protein
MLAGATDGSDDDAGWGREGAAVRGLWATCEGWVACGEVLGSDSLAFVAPTPLWGQTEVAGGAAGGAAKVGKW